MALVSVENNQPLRMDTIGGYKNNIFGYIHEIKYPI